ncbi:MAG: hypothetical protein IJW62_00175 [Clostridia bacterium]|nr:hypothetical protein [Clostridia bacterium]
MTKIIASKRFLAICLVLDLLFLIGLIGSLFFLFGAIIEGAPIVPWAILNGGFALGLLSFLFCTNRLGCIVTVDGNCVKRKGFFCGFQKVCKIQEIQKILVVEVARMGRMIVWVDPNSRHGFDFIRLQSWICFEYNDQNIAFVKSFWQGEIEFS